MIGTINWYSYCTNGQKWDLNTGKAVVVNLESEMEVNDRRLFSLNGKVALVTGSSRGLGWEMARALSSAGAHIILNSRSEQDLAPKIALIREAGGEATGAAFDVRDDESVKRSLAEIEKNLGGVDILVNNAGIVSRNLLSDLTENDWDSVIDVDLSSCFRLAKYTSRNMIAKKWGRIVNISSVMGKIARPTIIPYVAAKSGIHGLTRGLAVELAPYGITVNCIGPGFFPGSQNEVVRKNKEFYEGISKRTAIGRWGIPEELSGPIVFFCSNASSYCTGQVLMIDGGMTISL